MAKMKLKWWIELIGTILAAVAGFLSGKAM